MNTVHVRYFASIREALGTGEQVQLPAGTSVSTLRDRLIERSPAHAAALARGKALRCALNQALCEETAVVSEGAEVAFFPPVTGG
ncbi:MAG TPA: molybdopterin converting factor subunit 1 [Albitalea sp.]|uniref:molybdopterin converting factor subunit 1 n=1 Tax=Piscinibacter sp. TaxID=1903157 RepID=UPI002ED4976F